MIDGQNDDIVFGSQIRPIIEGRSARTYSVVSSVEPDQHRLFLSGTQTWCPDIEHKTVFAHPPGPGKAGPESAIAENLRRRRSNLVRIPYPHPGLRRHR